jgi:hypothetical protein
MTFDERFDDLDPSRWMPAYLPAWSWSSRADAAATYSITGDGLRLSIPVEQQLWCADLHQPPLRVSAVQSGNRSGPVGSTDGQQPFADGLTVREGQPLLEGFLAFRQRVEVEARATIAPGSMFSAWMVGMEDRPERCGEICVMEVFGEAIRDGSTGVGMGVHAFRDPGLTEEFTTHQLSLDVADWHRYAVDWRADGIRWSVDEVEVARSAQSPPYPMMLILGVFDFPGRSDPRFVPTLDVRRVISPG